MTKWNDFPFQIKLLLNKSSYSLVRYSASYSACVVKTIIHLSVVKVVDIYLGASWLGKYPPLFTSTSVNNC